MSEAAEFDVVIVGAGVAGALAAGQFAKSGLKVLVLEAGPDTTRDLASYNAHLETFYTASSKGAETPWPPAEGAPQPDGADLFKQEGYFVQRGPHLYGSTYTRTFGGSTLHWLGVSLRMLPEDFELRARHGVGRDWPIGYAALAPWYDRAEHAIGVSADVEEQRYHGLTFTAGYDYPMRRIPPSYSDRVLGAAVNSLEVDLGEERVAVRVRSYPAARNSIPRGDYQPIGALDIGSDGQERSTYIGERCEGNTACTPICPVQAKYNANKTFARADRRHLTLRSQAVASQILFDGVTGAVSGISYKRYDDPRSTSFNEEVATGRVYILAAHAVENAKLLLASGPQSGEGQVGRGLMDHPALYAWGLAPFNVGAFRGPQSSSGIEDFRAGGFRARHAAFRFDIGNDGWRAATGAPDATVIDAVTNQKLFGRQLRTQLADQLSRQVRMSLAVEQLPDPDNRVTIDPAYRDKFGNPRPVIDYRIADYTFEGMAAARKVAARIFRQAGIKDCSRSTAELRFPTAIYDGEEVHYHGMGHFAGTHAMGSDRSNSVVDEFQRSWDHPNLFLLGSGSFATMGTSNPTLTLAALALRTADHIIAKLHDGG
ncbi:GMC family oxidoreductase [uncultured Rhodoblastus sp.]|uniref:GMC family oxidoreductase n=1 Tax=uncultured Rhodoblastus sp. TaxID=543037 RepID=UPI0025FD354E|nr:GMC family oxidoreductase [uncultured Rhodoblastus sp.]